MQESHENAAPRFTTVVRGYDRLQVDDFVEHTSRWIEQAEYRAQQSEAAAAQASAETEQLRRRLSSMDAGPPRSATPESMKALGNRVGAIMQSSFQAAKELNTKVEDAARAATTAAEEKAARIVADATARADELSQAAEELFVQAQQALAGAGGAVAEQVDKAKAHGAAEREKILEQARTEARDLARRAAAEEHARREQLGALEDQRRRVLEEIGLLHQRLGSIGDGMSVPPPRPAEATQEPEPEPQPEPAPEPEPAQAAEPRDDETLVLERPAVRVLGPPTKGDRRRVASSAR